MSVASRNLWRRLDTPAKIQRFLDHDLGYNKEPHGPTCRSPRMTLEHGVAHCMEGALVAAAALAHLGHPPLLVDLEAVRDDDHVLAVYRVDGHWGSVAKSNYAGLRSREPVYRSLRELVMSYFEHYYNLAGEKTLRAYSRPVNLTRFRSIDWESSQEDVWAIPEHLAEIPHISILRNGQEYRLARMDSRLFEAGKWGMVK